MNISSFKGLNNVGDALRLGMRWLVQADNVDITRTGAIKKRNGYSRSLAGAVTGSYATLDYSRLYIVDGGVLKAFTAPSSAVPLQAGLSATLTCFTEINGQVFFSNGSASGVVLADHSVQPWRWVEPGAPTLAAVTGALPAGLYQAFCTFTLPDGRETGASEPARLVLAEGQALQVSGIPQRADGYTNVYIAPANSTIFQRAFTPAGTTAFVWNASADSLGVELLNPFLDPLPIGCSVLQSWRGRIYAAQYLADSDQTVVWFSQPLGYHLFDLDKDFLLLPRRVTMLAPHDDALIIGTDNAIHAYDGQRLSALADYGVVPGRHWATDDARVLFWTTRGVCAALPFTNLTERQVSVAPGLAAGGTIVRSEGEKRYLVALKQGGSAFNQRS